MSIKVQSLNLKLKTYKNEKNHITSYCGWQQCFFQYPHQKSGPDRYRIQKREPQHAYDQVPTCQIAPLTHL